MRYAAPGGAVLAVLALTLLPVAPPAPPAADACGGCNSPWAIEPLLNVGLYLPLGWLGVRAGGRMAWVVAAGLALSLLTEGLQLWIPGRTTSAADVAANGLGVLMGATLAAGGGRLRRWRAPMLALLLLAPLGLATWAFGQAAPEGPVRLLSGRYAGNGGAGVDSAALADVLRDGGALRFTLRADADEQDLIVAHDAAGREMLVLQASGPDLVLRARVRARDVGLLQRSLRVPGATGHARPVRLSGVVELDGRRWSLRLEEPRAMRATERWDAFDVWALFYPAGRVPARGRAVLRWLTLAALAVPVVLLSARLAGVRPGSRQPLDAAVRGARRR